MTEQSPSLAEMIEAVRRQRDSWYAYAHADPKEYPQQCKQFAIWRAVLASLERLEKLEAVAAAARDWHKDEFNGWSADKIVNDPQWSRAEYDYDIKLIRALAALDAQEAGE